MARPRRLDQIAATNAGPCDDRIVDVSAVRSARAALPAGDELAGLSGLFAALGDPTRLRLIAALASQELCVRDLATTIRQSESAVSHQLRLLRSQGLVAGRRVGRRVFYALDDQHVGTLYHTARTHIGHRLGSTPPSAPEGQP